MERNSPNNYEYEAVKINIYSLYWNDSAPLDLLETYIAPTAIQKLHVSSVFEIEHILAFS